MLREVRHFMQLLSFGAKRCNWGLHTPCYTVLQSSTLLCWYAALCCAAKQHVAVLLRSTLLCLVAACCCAAKQHVDVLRSSKLLCCETALCYAAKQHAVRSTGAVARSAEHVTDQAVITMLQPPGQSVWRGFANLVPHSLGLV